MSLDYWQMKINGCYVLHDNDYRRIMDVQAPNSSSDMDTDALLDNLAITLDNSMTVTFDDIAFTIPEDQYVHVRGAPLLLKRRSRRHYKLGATPELFGLSSGSRLHEALRYTLNPEYSEIRDIFKLDERSRVYSKYLSSHHTSRKTAALMFKNTEIARCSARGSSSKMVLSRSIIPDLVYSEIKDLLDVTIPYKSPEEVQEVLVNPPDITAGQVNEARMERILRGINAQRVQRTQQAPRYEVTGSIRGLGTFFSWTSMDISTTSPSRAVFEGNPDGRFLAGICSNILVIWVRGYLFRVYLDRNDVRESDEILLMYLDQGGEVGERDGLNADHLDDIYRIYLHCIEGGAI